MGLNEWKMCGLRWLISLLFISMKNRKQYNPLEIRDCLYKLWYIHTIECYETIKIHILEEYLTLWENVESVLLNDMVSILWFACQFIKWLYMNALKK